MKKFIAGFIVGIFLTCVFYFSPYADPRFRVYIGRLLDRDTIYLKNGSIVKGWIVKEQNDEIWIEVKEGYFTVLRSECESIEKDTLQKYIRKLI